jgi:hypothetical protein
MAVGAQLTLFGLFGHVTQKVVASQGLATKKSHRQLAM